MYKPTVKFFIRRSEDTKKKYSYSDNDAYPVLEGGNEGTAREWATAYKNIMLIAHSANRFSCIELLNTETRGQGGKLFKGRLFLEDVKTIEEAREAIKNSTPDVPKYVTIDIRVDSVLSMLQDCTTLGEGFLYGQFYITSDSGRYLVVNMKDDLFKSELEEYARSIKPELAFKNTIKYNDLKIGHVYKKSTKTKILPNYYMYMGDMQDSNGKIISVFFEETTLELKRLSSLFKFENMVNYIVDYKHPFGGYFTYKVYNNPSYVLKYLLTSKSVEIPIDTNIPIKDVSSNVNTTLTNYRHLTKLDRTLKSVDFTITGNYTYFKTKISRSFYEDVTEPYTLENAFKNNYASELKYNHSQHLLREYAPKDFYKQDLISYFLDVERMELTMFDVLFLANLHAYLKADLNHIQSGFVDKEVGAIPEETVTTYSDYLTNVLEKLERVYNTVEKPDLYD